MADDSVNKEVCSGLGEHSAHKSHVKESLQTFYCTDGDIVICLALRETNSCFFFIMCNGTIL